MSPDILGRESLLYTGQPFFTARGPLVLTPENVLPYAEEGFICVKEGLLHVDKDVFFAEDDLLLVDDFLDTEKGPCRK